jgi:hypothetical protein
MRQYQFGVMRAMAAGGMHACAARVWHRGWETSRCGHAAPLPRVGADMRHRATRVRRTRRRSSVRLNSSPVADAGVSGLRQGPPTSPAAPGTAPAASARSSRTRCRTAATCAWRGGAASPIAYRPHYPRRRRRPQVPFQKCCSGGHPTAACARRRPAATQCLRGWRRRGCGAGGGGFHKHAARWGRHGASVAQGSRNRKGCAGRCWRQGQNQRLRGSHSGIGITSSNLSAIAS